MTSLQEQAAIRTFTFDHVTLVLDNTSEAHEALIPAVRIALAKAGITTIEELERCDCGSGPYTYTALRKIIGEAVTTVLRDWIRVEKEVAAYPFLLTILDDLWDLSDERFVIMLGHRYLPEDLA